MSESSSEDENSDRLKEAVWSFRPHDGGKMSGNGGASCPYDGDSSSRRSQRTDVSKHEHDGNELRTTPEFQSHVAKKLGAFLDGCISEVFFETGDSKPGQSKNREEEDQESFRLFSTSAPGNWMEEPLPPPPKRRPIPSSSDSEMEMRFREAAVSVSDILASAAQLAAKTEEKSTTKESAEESTVTKKKKKKKKKRKASTERREENITQVSEKQSNREGTEEQTTVVENLTKKKKKKRIKLEEGRKDCDE